MHYVVMIVTGLIVGILARFLYPGAVHMGLIASALLGIAGAFLAGLVGRALHPATTGPAVSPGRLYLCDHRRDGSDLRRSHGGHRRLS